MHASKKDHENCTCTGIKSVFHHENIASLNWLIDGSVSYDLGEMRGNKESLSRLVFDSTALFTRAVAFFTAVILWVLICTPPFLKLSPSDCIAWKYCPKLWMDGTSNSAQVPRGWLLLTYLSPAWESIIVFTTIATNIAIRFQNFSFQNSCSSCSCRNWQSEALILGNKPIIPRKLHTTLALSLCHDFDHALKKKDSLTLILW